MRAWDVNGLVMSLFKLKRPKEPWQQFIICVGAWAFVGLGRLGFCQPAFGPLGA